MEVLLLDRPGCNAAIKVLPAFEAATGIKLNFTTVPYENALGEQVRDFVAGGDLDIALIDLVWISSFAENGWIEPIDTFTAIADLTDPELGGARMIGEKMEAALAEAGYYDGKKPLAQSLKVKV